MPEKPIADPLNEHRSQWAQRLYDDLSALPSASRLSGDQLEAIYALGYTHLTQLQYEQALSCFSLLGVYGPTHRRYLFGIAYCLQMLERYEEAIDVYSLVLAFFPLHYEAAVRIVECHLATENTEEARQMITWLEEIDRESEQVQPWSTKIKALSELMSGNSI